MSKAAAVYCRISKDRTGESLGVARQEADCRAWCERRGWPVAEIFTDNDVSAYSGKRRPAFESMVEGIKAGQFDAIVVWHPDRLTRSTKELEGIIDLVEATGVAVGTVTAGDYDLTTPEGRLTARIVGAVARKESEDKSRRSRRKHLELAEAGTGRGGGMRPFGFNADRLTINETEAELIREAASRVLAGESVRGICADWNHRGVRTVTDVSWAPWVLKQLLISGRVAGLREHRGAITHTAMWPAIISADDRLRLCAVFSDPTRRTSGSNARRYLLAGMVHCHACGAVMVARPTGRGVRRYICATGPGYKGCGGTYIGAEPLEELVSAVVREAIASPALSEAIATKQAGVGDEIDDIASAEARLAELADLWAAGDLDTTSWAAARNAVEKRLGSARSRLAAAQAPRALGGLPTNVDDLANHWDRLSFDRRRAILTAVMDGVIIGPGRRGYNKFDPKRLSFINWRA